MSHARVTIDGDTIINGNVAPNHNPLTPQMLADHLRPGTPPKPGIMALMFAFASAVKAKRDIEIDLTNAPDDGGYTLDVTMSTLRGPVWQAIEAAGDGTTEPPT